MVRLARLSSVKENNLDALPVRTASVFSDEHIRALNSMSQTKIVEENEYLFKEGVKADRIYLVQSGSVKLYRLLSEDAASTLALYFEGDLFGEADPKSKTVQHCRALALERTIVSEIMQKDINSYVREDGSFAEAYAAWSGLMNRITQSKFRDFLHYGKSGALCALLLRLSNTYAGETDGKRYINKRITNAEMAEMISATRESVNRLLGDLRNKKVISMIEGRIVLDDISYLRKVCNCDNCPLEICRM